MLKGSIIPIAFLLLAASACCQPEARNLGTPVRSMSIRESLLVIDPVTGRPTYYSGMFTSQGTARLIRFDYALGRVEYFPLPGTKGVYGLAEGPGGIIYCGTIYPARLFSFDPRTGEVRDLASAGGEEYIFQLTRGPGDVIYACTFPNAKVVAYDPADGGVEDLGSMHPTEKYCSEVAVADNGRVFCGISTSADIVVYDPVTFEKRSILPPGFEGANGAGVMAEGNIVFASVEGVLLVIDAWTYEVLMEIRHPEGGWIGTHVPISGGPVVIHGLPGGYVRYNATTGQIYPYYTPGFSTYDNASRVAYTRTAGRQIFQAHNMTTGEVISHDDVSGDGDGMDVFSLSTGPDGRIYGGSVSILHLFSFDPQTDVLEDLGFPYPGGGGEFYSLHTHGDRLYMAAYSGSELGVYRPSEPWNPGTEPTTNPRKIGSVGGNQNRPHAMTSSADGRVFVGSEPDYGQHGGALSIYDPVSDGFEVHRHIVPNQSILSLTAGRDGMTVYGGSSIRGGTGTEPLVRRAHFFAWDVARGEKVLDIVPVIGADDIESLATAPDGRIYGCAGSTLFVFDPAIGEVIHTQSAEEGIITEMFAWKDGLIYGRSERAIFRMKPLSGPGDLVRFELLHTAGDRGRGLALDVDGNIYFGVRSDVYVLENLPGFEPPVGDLLIYGNGLADDWTVVVSGGSIEDTSEMVEDGICQRLDIPRFCTLEYVPPDPWDITLWEYDRLELSINPGSSEVNKILVSKTGSGSTESISLLERYDVSLEPGNWSQFSVPVEDLDWAFGSRLGSLKLVVLGSGSIYLDSVGLAIPEFWPGAVIFLLACIVPSLDRKYLTRDRGSRHGLVA